MDAMVTVDEKKAHVVCVPLPAQSHIKCMLKLARLLHHKGIQITFVNIQSDHNRLFKSADPEDVDAGLETPVTCIISDGLMNYTKTPYAAERLGVPIILCWTLAACGFMACYQAKVLLDKGLVPIKDTNEYLDMVIDWIPGMEGIRLRDLPPYLLATKHDDPGLTAYVEAARMADKVSHMIIHTFYELEATLINELRSIFPQIYAVGPLQLHLNQEAENSKFDSYSLRKEESECVQWLDSKESNSVVYVSFGSEREISSQELLEFGWGLVNSNDYFLWIIRVDLVDGKHAVFPRGGD
ncbi:hypothetical protein L1987_22897 [Smallanthus sonchifolius]|uniref:Uncharacterized protein n=1 Tax=Smallanthus sonchifolius TaxID=185202 RepID=A0ACB9IFX9_9ASTR|nr:hypothetical protein L1987_22897 [Smallanthus sonchifolius]